MRVRTLQRGVAAIPDGRSVVLSGMGNLGAFASGALCFVTSVLPGPDDRIRGDSEEGAWA
jgi:hypothetical protein